MSISRLLAISAIFILASLAWLALGTSLVARTGEFDSRLGQEVAQLWGGEHRQVAPRVWVERPRQVTEQVSDGVRDGQVVTRTTTRTIVDHGAVPLAQSRLQVDLKLAHRQKGTAVVRHVWRRLSRAIQGSKPRPGRADARCGVHVSVGDGHLRPVHVPGESAVRRQGQRPVQGPVHESRAACRRRGAHRGGVRLARARQVELCLCRAGRVGGHRLRAGDDHRLCRRGLPRRHDVAQRQAATGRWMAALLAVRQPGHRPAGRDGPSQPPQSGPAGRAHHRVCSGISAVLPGRDGDPGRAAAAQPAPGELRVPLGGVLCVPLAAGLSGRPRRHPRRVRGGIGGEHRPGRVVPAAGQRDGVRAGERQALRSWCSWSSSATRSSSRAIPGSP